MRYLLRRLGFFVLTLWAALTLNFFIPRFMPGSPLQALRDRTHNKLSPAALQEMLTSFGFKPNQNIVVQYVEYLKQHGDRPLGRLHRGRRSASRSARSSARPCRGRSAWSASPPMLAFLLGSLVGIVAGWRRGGTARLDPAVGVRGHLGPAVLLGRRCC